MSGIVVKGFGRNRRAVVRDDGKAFRCLGDASLAAFGNICCTEQIRRAAETGEVLRGHTYRFAEGGGR